MKKNKRKKREKNTSQVYMEDLPKELKEVLYINKKKKTFLVCCDIYNNNKECSYGFLLRNFFFFRNFFISL